MQKFKRTPCLRKYLVYDISHKTLIERKPLCIGFSKVNGFIRGFDATQYFVLFVPEKS